MEKIIMRNFEKKPELGSREKGRLSLKKKAIANLTAAAFAAWMGAGSAQAAVVAYEGFNSYSAGGLNADNGGTGWSTSWAVPATGSLRTNVNVVSGGLSYTGGSISVNGGANAVAVTNATNDASLITRQFSNQTGSELYFSFLFQPNGYSSDDFIQFWLGTNATQSASGSVGLLNSFGLANYTARLTNTGGTSGGDAASSTAPVNGTTVLIVGRISTDGTLGAVGVYDQMQLWVNPTSIGGAANATASFNSGLSSTTGVDWFGVRTVNLDAADNFKFDELTVGTDFASVVPEPSTYLLFGVGLAALFYLRRKRTF